MKKIIIIYLFILLLITPKAIAEDSNPYNAANETYNGRFIMSEEISDPAKNMYIIGVMDGLTHVYSEWYSEHYSNSRKPDILDAVKLYYQKNPTQRYRSVGDVILSGCK